MKKKPSYNLSIVLYEQNTKFKQKTYRNISYYKFGTNHTTIESLEFKSTFLGCTNTYFFERESGEKCS